MKSKDFENEYRLANDAKRLKETEFERYQARIKELSELLLDTKEDKRSGLVTELSRVLQERDVVILELEAIRNRRKENYLAIYEKQLAEAKRKVSEVLQIASENKEVMEGIMAEIAQLRRRYAGKERDERFIELETKLAGYRASAYVYQSNLMQAKNAVRRCEMELDEVKAEVEKW